MSQSSSSSKSSTHYWVWSLPVVALAVVSWLGYQSLVDQGPTLEIAFEDGRGIVRGQTMVHYRGLPVGKVIDARLTEDLSQVVAIVQLDKEARGIAVEGSQFWVIRPEISLNGISGLDTILSGVYIAVEPGAGKSATTFKGLNAPPLKTSPEDLIIQLVTERAHSLQVGSPVFFRNIQVGKINQLALSGNGHHVILEAGIRIEYAHLVHRESRFWNESGINVKGSLLGVKIRTDSLETLIRGGVSFATPEEAESEGAVESGERFFLHDEPEEDWLEWGGKIPEE